MVLVPFDKVFRQVHSGFMVETLPGAAVELASCEQQVSTHCFCSFTRILSFQSRPQEREVRAESEMPFEKS